MRTAARAALFVAWLVGGVAGAQRAPDEAALVSAVESGDPETLGRVARRLGVGRLGRLLAEGKDKALVAALRAAPLLTDAWALLPPTVTLLTHREPTIAVAAARAAAEIARGWSRDDLLTAEAPPDELHRAAVGCAVVAARAEGRVDVRVPALECAAALARTLGSDAPAEAQQAAASLLVDADPSVRRAAADLVDPVSTRAPLLARADDPEPAVAAAALAALCAADPAGTVAALGEAQRARLAELSGPGGPDPGYSAAMRPCVKRIGKPKRRRK